MDINVARFAGEIVSFIRPYRLLGKKKQTTFQIQELFFKAEIQAVSSVLKAIEQLVRV